jgi:hypothetical protein
MWSSSRTFAIRSSSEWMAGPERAGRKKTPPTTCKQIAAGPEQRRGQGTRVMLPGCHKGSKYQFGFSDRKYSTGGKLCGRDEASLELLGFGSYNPIHSHRTGLQTRLLEFNPFGRGDGSHRPLNRTPKAPLSPGEGFGGRSFPTGGCRPPLGRGRVVFPHLHPLQPRRVHFC